MIEDSILAAYIDKYKRNWDTLYIAIDLHGTIIERYTGDEIKPYDWADEALKYLTSLKDIVLILFTSTYPHKLLPFFKWCEKNKIVFKYLNENPECSNNSTGDFSRKFYFNILLDDRAGFNPDSDWIKVNYSFKNINKMFKCPKTNQCVHGMKYNQNPATCCLCSKLKFFYRK